MSEAELQGFFYPRTATGRASLLPPPPWYYSGDLLTVEYRTDPARVAALLPEPLAPADEDPGAVALIWADWQSCGAGREELLGPGAGAVQGGVRRRPLLVRGPDVLALRIHLGGQGLRGAARHPPGVPEEARLDPQTRPHPMPQGAPQLAPGGRFGATLAAADRRLAQAWSR